MATHVAEVSSPTSQGRSDPRRARRVPSQSSKSRASHGVATTAYVATKRLPESASAVNSAQLANSTASSPRRIQRQSTSAGQPSITSGSPLERFASCALFTALALSGNRFVATYAVVATPWLARDFDDWLGTRRARRGSERPWLVGLLTSATCVAMCLYEWTHFENPIGLHPDARHYPVAACDFIAANDVRGRGINDFYLGGYMLWRFWPDRSRLPFADIHPEDMPAATRLAYLSALHSERGWQQLDGSYHFDYALLSRSHVGSGGLLDVLDRRAEWALVFVDDVAALYVRRDGAAARVAATKAYRDLPGGETKLIELVMGCAKDPALARETRDELARQARSSPWSRRFAALARTLELSAAERAPNR